MLSVGNAIHPSHGNLLGRVDSAWRSAIPACKLPRFPCTSWDSLKTAHQDVLSGFSTSTLGWGFGRQVADWKEIYGPVIALDSERLWSHGRETITLQGRPQVGLLVAPGITWARTVPMSRATGLSAGNRNVLQVLGKQLHPLKCYEYNHLRAQIVLPTAKSSHIFRHL